MPPNNSDSSQSPDDQPPKRCEYVGEFVSRDPTNAFKTCCYKCKGYGAIATFPWPKDQPCPPSFDSNFPGP